MKDFDTTKVPETMSTRGMFAAVLGAQNHGDTDTVEAMFHKRGKNSELFDGNFMIDDETSRMRICFMPKLRKNLATQEYRATYNIDHDDLYGQALQGTIDSVMNIIRDFVKKDYKVIIGDAKIKTSKLFNGEYSVSVSVPFIADNEVDC